MGTDDRVKNLPPGAVLRGKEGDKKTKLPPGAVLREPAPEPQTPGNVLADAMIAPWESLASLATGAIAQPIAGWGGLLAAPYVGLDKAADITKSIQGAMTYEPRTGQGMRLNELASAPFEWYTENVADPVGGFVTDHFGPEAGTAAYTAVQGAPGVLGYKAGEAIKPSTVPKPAPRTSVAAPKAKQMAEAAGIPWDSLPGNVKERITALSKNASEFVTVDKMALERIIRGESLPVPVKMSKGQALRDPAQMRSELILAETTEGAAVRDLQTAQNKALLDNLDVIEGRTGGRVKGDPEGLGKSLTQERIPKDPNTKEGALAMAARNSNEKVGSAYNKANNSVEGLQKVDPTPLVEWLAENEVAASVAPAISAIKADLKRKNIIDLDDQGNVVIVREPTLREMERIRQLAVKLGKGPDTNGHMMSELKKVIDGATESAGGDLYKAARAERRRHAVEYENPKLIADLLKSDEKGRGVALEKVWQKTVIGGSIAEVQLLKNTLLKHPDPKVRAAGKKAWRDLAGQTVGYLREQATRIVAPDAAGNPEFSVAGLSKAMDRIGEKKMIEILGEPTTRQLQNLVEVSRDTKTLPPYRGGSSTAPNLAAVFDKLTGNIPGLGPLARGGVDLAKKAWASAKRPAQARAAVAGPQIGPPPAGKPGMVSAREALSKPRVSPLIPLSQVGLPMAEDRQRAQGWKY